MRHSTATRANVALAFRRPMAKNSRSSVPTRTIKKLRMASAVNMATRISVRLEMMEDRYSDGRLRCNALISADEMNDEKHSRGATAKRSATPPVSRKLTRSGLNCSRMICGRRNTSRSAIMASRGMVNSAITRMDDTVRNLEYMGT